MSGDILDEEVMHQSFGGDSGFMCDGMALYLRDAPSRLQAIRDALEAEDNDALISNAHALKGMTGYYNRAMPYDTCLALEMLGRERGLPEKKMAASSQLSMLELQLRIMMQKMKDFVASHS